MDVQLGLNKIADALKVEIHYDSGKVTGKGELVFTPFDGLSIPVKMQVDKVFINDCVGVVVHVIGALSLIASYREFTKAMNIFMVDGDKVLLDGVVAPLHMVISKNMTIRKVIDTLGEAVVCSYLWDGKSWNRLALPRESKC